MPRGEAGISAVVSGHSRGLGAAIAADLLERGVRVIAISRGRNVALARRFGDRLSEVQIDLSDVDPLDAWLASDELADALRAASMALLVNNAGVLQPLGPLQSQQPGAVARAVAVNVGAALALSAAFVAATDGVPDRRILHISSGAGRQPVAGWSVYCATKAALDHHARSVALDKTRALRISSVAPGVIDTEMQAEIRASREDFVPDKHRFVEMKREGRLISPENGARAVVDFLLADAFGSEAVSALR